MSNCEHCDGAEEIETDNNGPIVPCPVCKADSSEALSHSITLDPCPFCEGPPVPIVVKTMGGGVFDWDNIPDDGIMVDAYVFCHECGAHGSEVDDLVYEKEECLALEQQAVTLWQARNNRHRDLYDGSDHFYPKHRR